MADREAGRQARGQAGKQAGRQAGWQAGRQADGQTGTAFNHTPQPTTSNPQQQSPSCFLKPSS